MKIWDSVYASLSKNLVLKEFRTFGKKERVRCKRRNESAEIFKKITKIKTFDSFNIVDGSPTQDSVFPYNHGALDWGVRHHPHQKKLFRHPRFDIRTELQKDNEVE